MKHSVDEIWQFLRDNSVKKVRTNDDYFEFLTVTSERISQKIFIRKLLAKIQGRPKHLIIKKVSVQHRDGYGLRTHPLEQPQSKKQGHPEVEAFKVWNKDIQELHNKVLYNEVKIPQNLAIHSDEELKNQKEQIEAESDIDQDTDLLKFRNECIKRKLVKKKTIPRKILYEIMVACKLFKGSFEDFSTTSRAYAKGREYASRLGYSSKLSAIFHN